MGFRGTGKTDWNFTYAGQPFDSDRWSDLKAHQPFFAQVNFQETHRTFHAPQHADPAKVEIPPYYPDHPVTREDWAKYLDAATELDRKVGLVLEQLEADGLADNTVVVFFGDNGQAHVRGKQFCYDSGLHVPLIIRWPKRFPAPKHFAAGHGGRPAARVDRPRADDAGHRRRRRSPQKMQGEVFLGDRPARRASTSSAPATAATRRCSASARSATTATATSATSRPSGRSCSRTTTRSGSTRSGTCSRSCDAEGKLTPLQKLAHRPDHARGGALRHRAPTRTRRTTWPAQPSTRPCSNELRGVLEKWIDESNDQGRELEPPRDRRSQRRHQTRQRSQPGARPKAKRKAKTPTSCVPSEVIERVDQRIQLVLRLGGLPSCRLGRPTLSPDRLPAGQHELLVPLADRRLLGRFARVRRAEQLRQVDLQRPGHHRRAGDGRRLVLREDDRVLGTDAAARRAALAAVVGCSTRIVSTLSTP